MRWPVVFIAGALLHAATSVYGQDPDTYEPDNTRQTATPIIVTDVQRHTISPESDIDFFSFTLSETSRIVFIAEQINFFGETLIRLYDSYGAQLDFDFDQIERTLTAGSYFISVEDNNADTLIEYDARMAIISTRPDSFEPDNTSAEAHAIPLGGRRAGHTIAPAGDQDWFTFTLTDTTHVVIQAATPLVTDEKLVITLYNSQFSELDQSSSSRLFQELVSGQYFIRITEDDNDQVTGGYLLQLWNEAGPDTHEDDDTPATASFIGPVRSPKQTHNFHDAFDEDWILFYFNQPGPTATININISNIGADADVYTQIYEADGVTLIDEGYFLTFSPSDTGFYLLRLTNTDGAKFGLDTAYTVGVPIFGQLNNIIPGSLFGTVTTPAKATPIENASVSVQNFGGLATSTDFLGAYLFPALPTGDYTVTVTADGFLPSGPRLVSLGSGGTNLDIVLEPEIPPVTVPDVVALPRAAAEAAILDAGLTVGAVTEQNSETVPEGSVISQNPEAGAQVAAGSAVDLVVSLGPPLVLVPDVAGLEQFEAETAITNAGLVVGVITQQFSDIVPSGHVISQDPPGGAEALLGSAVDLVISLGAPLPGSLAGTVTEFGTGAPIGGATVTILELSVSTLSDPSDGGYSFPAVPAEFEPTYTVTASANGFVSKTDFATIVSGEITELHFQLERQIVSVPNVVGLTQAAAETAINGAGLTVGAITQQHSGGVPAGQVISQDPLAGANAASGSAVNLVVSLGPEPILVPSVVGQSQAGAEAAIALAGFVTGTITFGASDTIPAGVIVAQNPLAGTLAAPGSPINLTVSIGPTGATGQITDPAQSFTLIFNRDGDPLDGSSVLFPPDSLPEPSSVFFIPETPPAGLPTHGHIALIVTCGPSGLTFDPPAQISLPWPHVPDGITPVFTVAIRDPQTGELDGSGIANVAYTNGVITFTTTHFSAFAVVTKAGDVNVDGAVTSVDVQLTINAALDLAIGVMDADIDNNGDVNSVDVQLAILGALAK